MRESGIPLGKEMCDNILRKKNGGYNDGKGSDNQFQRISEAGITQKKPAGRNCFASVFPRASYVRNVDAKSFLSFAAGTSASVVPAVTRPPSLPER